MYSRRQKYWCYGYYPPTFPFESVVELGWPRAFPVMHDGEIWRGKKIFLTAGYQVKRRIPNLSSAPRNLVALIRSGRERVVPKKLDEMGFYLLLLHLSRFTILHCLAAALRRTTDTEIIIRGRDFDSQGNPVLSPSDTTRFIAASL